MRIAVSMAIAAGNKANVGTGVAVNMRICVIMEIADGMRTAVGMMRDS